MSDTSDARNLLVTGQSTGPRLRVAREKAGLTQQELAQRVGVERASIAAWENDERQPRANRVIMLCGVLDVSLKWLLEGREDAHMAQEEEALPVIRSEMGRLRSILEEATALAGDLCTRVDSLKE